jgi:hypothetical protein
LGSLQKMGPKNCCASKIRSGRIYTRIVKKNTEKVLKKGRFFIYLVFISTIAIDIFTLAYYWLDI